MVKNENLTLDINGYIYNVMSVNDNGVNKSITCNATNEDALQYAERYMESIRSIAHEHVPGMVEGKFHEEFNDNSKYRKTDFTIRTNATLSDGRVLSRVFISPAVDENFNFIDDTFEVGFDNITGASYE